jgi:hypothetical protein
MPMGSTKTAPPHEHPQSVFSRVATLCAKGDIKLYSVDERTLETFMAFKLALPSADDHTAALLTLTSAIASHPTY